METTRKGGIRDLSEEEEFLAHLSEDGIRKRQ